MRKRRRDEKPQERQTESATAPSPAVPSEAGSSAREREAAPGHGCDTRVYDRHASKQWVEDVTARNFSVEVNEEAVALQGTCRRCGHQIDDFIPLDLDFARRFPKGEAEIVKEPLDPELRVRIPTVLACNCGASHAGRAEGDLGCGAYGGLIVELEECGNTDGEPPRSEAVPRVRLRPDVARTAELMWDRQAAEIEHNRLSAAQSTAGKWSATVTAVLGAFGVATLIEGAESIRDLEQAWAIVVGALAVLAAISAVLAIGYTAVAAQGLLRVAAYVTGASLRRTTHQAARASTCHTRRGAKATFLSAALVIAALVVLAAAPRESPEVGFLRIESRANKIYCGTQLTTPPGLVGVKAQQGLPSEIVPLAEVRELKVVGAC